MEGESQPADTDVEAAAKQAGVMLLPAGAPDPTGFGVEKATGIGPEPSFLQRMGDAVGPAIRGAGDVTGANWLLERTGMVPEGRLSGDEPNARAAQVRHTTGVGGVASMGAGVVGSIANAGKSGMVPAAIETARQASPLLKYEAVKFGLDKMGVPGSDILAFLVAGGTNGRAEAKGTKLRTPSTAATPESPTARVPGRLVLTPDEVGAADQLKRAYRPGASLEGMKSAAKALPGDTTESAASNRSFNAAHRLRR